LEPLIKAYIVEHTGRFILSEPAIRDRVDPSLLQEIEARTSQKATWYPRRAQVELWRAIVATQPDEAGAYDALVRSGEYVGTHMTTTFLRLLFKVLTPKMFGAKFPDLYKRDHHGGGEGVVEEVAEKRVVLSARDIEGFDHFGPNTVGFARVAFAAMGLKNVRITCSPWSLEAPGPKDVRFVAEWD
jgi:hypothetical protein